MVLCEVCSLEVTEKNWANHSKKKGHLLKLQDLERCHRSVFVAQYPAWAFPGGLEQHFSFFGPVVKVYKAGPTAAFVEFEHVASCDRAVAYRQHMIGHSQLYVSPKNPPRGMEQRKHDRQKVISQLSALQAKLGQISSITAQMDHLRTSIQLSRPARDLRQQVQRQIQTALRVFIPEVCLSIYGSVATGLATSGCDVDLFLHYDESRSTEKPVQMLPRQLLKPPLEIAGKRVVLSSLTRLPTAQQVVFHMNLLKSSQVGADLNQFFPITTSRVPLLHFEHKHHHFSCDMTFTSGLSIHNTELLTLLLKLDPRFVNLMFTIKYWAKMVGLAVSTSPASLRATSYSLTLLVYFYLQNTTPPVLPTLQQLVQLSEPGERVTVEGWDCGFCKDVDKIRKSLLILANTESAASLLRGFFLYYADVDLTSSVLRPHTGDLVPLLTFRHMIQDDNTLNTFKMDGFFVQDPINLSHNTMGNLQCPTIQTCLTHNFLGTAEAIHDAGDSWGLRTILPQQPQSVDYIINQLGDCEDDLLFPLQLSALSDDLWTGLTDSSEVEHRWKNQTLELLGRVLGILRIEYVRKDVDSSQDESQTQQQDDDGEKTEVESLEPPRKKPRTSGTDAGEQETASSRRHSLKFSLEKRTSCICTFDCSMHSMLWCGRKEVIKKVNQGEIPKADEFTKEEEVTRILLLQNPTEKHSSNFTICCNKQTIAYKNQICLHLEGEFLGQFQNFPGAFKKLCRKLIRSELYSCKNS